MTDQQDENKLIAERRAKLTALREEGGAVFPNDFRPEHSAAELQSGFGHESKEDLEKLGKDCVGGWSGNSQSRCFYGGAGQFG